MKINGCIKSWKNNFQKKKVMQQKKINCISTQELKILFNREAKIYFEEKNKNFVVDEKNRTFLNLICKYFAKDRSFETDHRGDLSKGLFIIGPNGTGKSSSLRIMQLISRKYNLQSLWFPIIETYKVVENYNTDRHKDFVLENYSKGKYLFDDLGAEPEASNTYVFGKKDIFTGIMQSRYDAFIRKGTITHITSNLYVADVKARYGSRVEDRFYEMFNILELDGDSRR